MKKMLLLAIVLVAALYLGGCMVIDCDEHRHAGPPRVACPPAGHMVEVIHVPGPHPRPPQHPQRPHRRW